MLIINHVKDIDVLVIGRSCVDYIAVVDRFPKGNTKVPLSCRLVEGGGQGGTAACCISKLGGRVVYIGSVGNDKEGEFCLKRLQDYNVGIEHVRIVDGITPVAYVFVESGNGKRTIIYDPGNLPEIAVDKKLIELINASMVILLDPQVTYLSQSLDKKNMPHLTSVYDCERFRTGLYDMMKTVDFFVPSTDFFDSEELKFSGKSLKENITELKKMVKGELIVTNGENGAYYLSNELYHFNPPVVSVKDTTGAGDNLHAALSFALSREFDIFDAICFSVATASISCREYGGRLGLPSFEEAMKASKEVEITIEKIE